MERIKVVVPKKQMDELADRLVALTAAIDAIDTSRTAHGFLGGEHGYGAHWDSSIFTMRPFYWGDCDCGAEERSEAWFATHPHANDCYYVELGRRETAYDERSGYAALEAATGAPGTMAAKSEKLPFGTMHLSFRTPKGEAAHEAWRKAHDAQTKAHRNIAIRLCREYGIPWNKGWGSSVHCTCGRDQLAKAADLGHRDACALELPNFRHKASGFEVRWYKYIGRSQEVLCETPPDLAAMFAECLLDVAAASPAERGLSDGAHNAPRSDSA